MSSSSTFSSDDVVESNSTSIGFAQKLLSSVVRYERRSSKLQASLDADESSSTEIHVVIVCAEDRLHYLAVQDCRAEECRA